MLGWLHVKKGAKGLALVHLSAVTLKGLEELETWELYGIMGSVSSSWLPAKLFYLFDSFCRSTPFVFLVICGCPRFRNVCPVASGCRKLPYCHQTLHYRLHRLQMIYLLTWFVSFSFPERLGLSPSIPIRLIIPFPKSLCWLKNPATFFGSNLHVGCFNLYYTRSIYLSSIYMIYVYNMYILTYIGMR